MLEIAKLGLTDEAKEQTLVLGGVIEQDRGHIANLSAHLGRFKTVKCLAVAGGSKID